MPDLERILSGITLAPYIVKAMALIGVQGKAGSNAFRHQINTLAVLLDYKITDPVLLKASVIHDLFEDATGMPGVSRDAIVGLDSDGAAVFDLVMEVTQVLREGKREPKSEYLIRVLEKGSARARLLKLADRISNLYAIGFVHDERFVRRYTSETRQYVLPHAELINKDMFREMSDLLADREKKLELRFGGAERQPPATPA